MLIKFKLNKISLIIILNLVLNNFLTAKINNRLEFGYGYEKLKPENSRFIKNIIEELNMHGYNIKIYKMNSRAIKQFGYQNAFVTSENNLYISEGFFEELTNRARRFLIGHELTHIKKSHHAKQLIINITSFITSLILIDIASKYIDNNYLNKWLNKKNKFYQYILSKVGSKLVIIPSFMVLENLIIKFFSRYCEKEADREAVLNLNDTKGGINFLKHINTKKKSHQNRLLRFINSFFDTHPSIQERINLLKNIELQIDR